MVGSSGPMELAGGAPRRADRPDTAVGESPRRGIGSAALTKVAVLGGLFVAANYWQFPVLVRTWLGDDNWTHGFVIPLFSLYLIFIRRGELRAAARRTCLWGLPLMVLAIAVTIVAYYPVRTYWFAHVGMLLLGLGLVLYLAGPHVLRLTWLPILFPIFAMPLPPRVYTALAYPLQELAARGTAVLLGLLGVGIEVHASALRVLGRSGQWHALTVAEACSGLRALMAFVALGVAMAWLEQRPLWQRLVMVALAVPIAVASNCIRVAVTCSMYALDRPELGRDFMESFVGLLLLVPAFFMFWLVGWVLSKLFVDAHRPGRAEPTPARAVEGQTA